MRKLIISYLLVSVALPATAQVDMAIHRLCSDTKDYEGCVKTQMLMKNEDNSKPIKEVTTEFKDLTPWGNT